MSTVDGGTGMLTVVFAVRPGSSLEVTTTCMPSPSPTTYSVKVYRPLMSTWASNVAVVPILTSSFSLALPAPLTVTFCVPAS